MSCCTVRGTSSRAATPTWARRSNRGSFGTTNALWGARVRPSSSSGSRRGWRWRARRRCRYHRRHRRHAGRRAAWAGSVVPTPWLAPLEPHTRQARETQAPEESGSNAAHHGSFCFGCPRRDLLTFFGPKPIRSSLHRRVCLCSVRIHVKGCAKAGHQFLYLPIGQLFVKLPLVLAKNSAVLVKQLD